MKPPTLFANCIPAAGPPWISVLFLLVFVFCAPAEPQQPCPESPCPDGITKIADCPDEGCGDHAFDPELNTGKNIRSDNQQPVLRSIRWIKGLEDPANFTECGSRDELKQLGEGKKITFVAWALTARRGSSETCNCQLRRVADTDNHIVLVDPGVKKPTLAKNEGASVTAEFTPRTRLDHPNFTRLKLNRLIDPSWKTSQANPTGKLLVRVTGLLLFDSFHFVHTALTRDTNWEIHPILKFEYCPKDKKCRADSDENWIDFDTH
jgi:hypothetical protein